MAQICGLNLVIHAEELEELIKLYEFHGYFDELTLLLEAGVNLERSHMAMFTELAICYTKYKPEKLLDNLKMFSGKLNIPKVIKACDTAHLWKELSFLQVAYEEYDNAILTQMKYASAFDHEVFKNVLLKVGNLEICYKGIKFYMEEHPLHLNDLLTVLSNKIDATRIVQIMQKANQLPLVKSYLQSIQQVNNAAVNLALNELYLSEGDYLALKSSIERFENFDNMQLAQKLEKHESIEFRRIAAILFKKNRKYKQSMLLSQDDNMYKDAMETAAESRDHETAEELLEFFIKNGKKEYFAACLYICYDLLRPDVVIELAWRHGLSDFAMPYMCQVLRETSMKIEYLEKENKERREREEQNEKRIQEAPIIGRSNVPLMLTGNGWNQ